MQPHVKIGRIAGIDIGLHYSWLIIALLITLSLRAHFHDINPQWEPGTIWTAAIVTGVLFFASIVVHELAHALVARARNLPVQSITLFALGGVAHIERDAGDPKTEFWMGIAGPVMSVVIGGLSLGLAWAIGGDAFSTPSTPLMAVLVWLGYINFMLATFNMIPGFPLDGGRVLRALLWWTTGDADRSTRLAARAGQGVGFLFILIGVWQFLSGAGLGSLWIALIGWFLLDAAGASYAQVGMVAGLRGLRVKDIMTDDCVRIDGNSTIETFADEYLLRTWRRCFVVEEGGKITGLVTPSDVKQVERSRWPTTAVHTVMRPLSRLRTVTPDTPLIEALHTMGRDDVNQLPVVFNDRLQGVLSRSHIMQVLQSRAELSM